MHDAKRKSFGSGSINYFDFDFEIKEKIISVEAFEFVKLIKELNEIFSQLVKDVKLCASKNDKEDDKNSTATYDMIYNQESTDIDNIIKTLSMRRKKLN